MYKRNNHSNASGTVELRDDYYSLAFFTLFFDSLYIGSDVSATFIGVNILSYNTLYIFKIHNLIRFDISLYP